MDAIVRYYSQEGEGYYAPISEGGIIAYYPIGGSNAHERSEYARGANLGTPAYISDKDVKEIGSHYYIPR